jgi:hypothetical protein
VAWRRWNNVFHRDLGYLCVGLTLVYAVSGVAVNHVDAWNPSYDITHREADVGSLGAVAPASDAYVRAVLGHLGLGSAYRATFRPDSSTLRIFLRDGTVDVNAESGHATVEIVRRRPVLHAVNFLHLNHAKRLWTWMADLYAVALGLLAITGLFVLKGRTGITGRGAWLTAIGAGVPLVFFWLYAV